MDELKLVVYWGMYILSFPVCVFMIVFGVVDTIRLIAGDRPRNPRAPTYILVGVIGLWALRETWKYMPRTSPEAARGYHSPNTSKIP